LAELIYLADDDGIMRKYLQQLFEREGYVVESFSTGDDLFATFQHKPCDIVILDIIMPGNSGFTVCAMLKQTSHVPLILLSTKDKDDDYIMGITLGADVYLTKPVNPAKLLLHVKVLLAKSKANPIVAPNNQHAHTQAQEQSNIYKYADITINKSKITADCNGAAINFTHNEFNLLLYLITNQDRAISREELLREVWGYDNIVESRATDDTAKRLRKKLLQAGSGVTIGTVWGFGFRLDVKKSNI